MDPNESKSHIGTLCIDSGGEHTSNEFAKYLHQNEIQRQNLFHDVFQRCKTDVLG